LGYFLKFGFKFQNFIFSILISKKLFGVFFEIWIQVSKFYLFYFDFKKVIWGIF
jgi:hypothetical protein